MAFIFRFFVVRQGKIMKINILPALTIIALIAPSAWAKQVERFLQVINGGYWAMAKPVGDEYLVVNFYQKNGSHYSDNYRFSCQNGKYKKLGKETAKLIVDTDGLLVQGEKGQVYSKLTPMFIKPKEGLILKQTMTDALPALKQLYPDGILLVYFYTPKLKPAC